MLLSYCLIHIAIVILRHILYLVYLCPCLGLGLFMSYLCDVFFISSLVISYNLQVISYNLVQTDFKLSFCLIFCQLQPGVAYKNVSYRKKRVLLDSFFIKINYSPSLMSQGPAKGRVTMSEELQFMTSYFES